MQLHQLLRYITDGTSIIIFDLKGRQVCSVYTKHNINLDLYEYDILEVTCGQTNRRDNSTSLYITIQK